MNSRHIRFAFPILLALTCSAASAQSPSNDVVELFNGQVFHGKITDTSLTIAGSLGTLTTPFDRVATLASQPAPRFMQILTLRNGNVLTGRIQAASIHLTDQTGAASEIQLAQISRLSPEVRAAPAPATNPAPAAAVFAVGGDHLAILMPASITFRSRWGDLAVSGDILRQLLLVDHNQPAHRLVLSDGSTFSGILTQSSLDLHPDQAPDVTLATPTGQIARIAAASPDSPHAGPKLDMVGGDILRGAIQGTLTLQTQFGPVAIEAATISKLSPDTDSPGDITITQSDGHVLKGAPQDGPVSCKLDCGLTISVPAAMIADYAAGAAATPLTTAPPANDAVAQSDPAVVIQVQTLLKRMAGTNQQVVVRAQNDLVFLGNPAINVLHQLRPSQPAKVQLMIDSVLARISPSNPGPQQPQ